MSCPVCDGTMASVGDRTWHCGRCGTLKQERDGYSQTVYIPKWTEQVDGVSLYHRLLAACAKLSADAFSIDGVRAFLAENYYPGELFDAMERVTKADGDCYGR